MKEATNTPNRQNPPREGQTTAAVERVTANLPSITWLWLAGGSLLLSAALAMTRHRKDAANFVGLWVPSFLLLGIYNKLVKQHGSDKAEMEAHQMTH
jgi:hypothetical protein